jgi:hypothetical protein
MSICSHRYVSLWPSASLPEPVSVNGVRIGIVLFAGAFTVGELLPAGTVWLPPLSASPPFAVSPTKPLTPGLGLVTVSWGMSSVSVMRGSSGRGVGAKITWKPVSSGGSGGANGKARNGS